MEPFGWRAYVTRDGESFIRNEVRLFLAVRSKGQTFPAKPIVIYMDSAIPEGAQADVDIEPTILPMDLAQALYEALAHAVYGVPDLPVEVARLKRELSKSEDRVDKLISGIGRLGGETE